jgi:hypothetical protein
MSKKESVVEQSTKEPQVEKPLVDESSWKQELEQLDRLLTGRLTEAEARGYAENELAKHDGVVHVIEKQIAQAQQVLSEQGAFLPRTDNRDIENRIESLQYDLSVARKKREQSINKCGAGIKAAKDADKLRPRWQELRRRQQGIDKARDIARGREQELRVSMPQRFVG